jgi:tRNA pseudouridine55 synthase
MTSSQSGRIDLHGALVIDKPPGWTSHDVVARLRKLTGVRRIGHAGTLDPFATGVLPIGIGKATRLIQYAQADEKVYEALVILGIETDSGDLEGTVVARETPVAWPSAGAVQQVIDTFVGKVQQVPPAFSAIKVDGRRLYERARAGEVVDVPARLVRIDEIRLVSYQPPAVTIQVRCGPGTYIRALARDIGRALGVGGHCQALRRLRVGDLDLAGAWTLDELERFDSPEQFASVVLAPDRFVAALPAVVISRDQVAAWYDGRLVTVLETLEPDTFRVYDPSGRFLGLGTRRTEHVLHPSLVFKTESDANVG